MLALVLNRTPIESDVGTVVRVEVLLAENKCVQRRTRNEASLRQMAVGAITKGVAQADNASDIINFNTNNRLAALDKEVLRRHVDGVTRRRALSIGAAGDIVSLVTGQVGVINREVGSLALLPGELEEHTVAAGARVDVGPVAVKGLIGTMLDLDMGCRGRIDRSFTVW